MADPIPLDPQTKGIIIGFFIVLVIVLIASQLGYVKLGKCQEVKCQEVKCPDVTCPTLPAFSCPGVNFPACPTLNCPGQVIHPNLV